jgi:N-methylhydantoinase A/oxoprolinase/acetone carboxylase beta subunit
VVNRYIHRLEEALQSAHYAAALHHAVNGSSLTGSALRNIPVRMIESGPAAGVWARRISVT